MNYEDVLILRDKVTATTQKITRSFKNVQKEGDKTKQTLAKIGSIGKKAMVGLAVGVTAVYGATAKLLDETAKYGDKVDKMSQKIGISRTAFQEWNFILSQNGGNVESLQMGMKAMSNQLDGVAKGSKDSIKYFKQLGVKVKDNKGQFRSQEAIFNDVISSLGKMKNQTQKTIIANKLFGRSANDLKPLLNQTAESIEEQRKQAHDLGLVMSDEAVDSAVVFTDTLDQAQRSLAGVGYEIGASLMPSVTELVQEIIAQREQIKNFISGVVMIAKVIGSVIANISNIFASLGTFIGTIIGKILSIPTNISRVFSEIATSIAVAFANIRNAVIKTIQSILKYIQPLINGINNIKAGFQGASLSQNTRAGDKYNNFTRNTTNNNNYFQNRNNITMNGTIREEADINKLGTSIVDSLMLNNLNRGGAY